MLNVPPSPCQDGGGPRVAPPRARSALASAQEQAAGGQEIVDVPGIRLAQQIDRVPSMRVPLDREQERRFNRLLDEITMIDLHQHPLVLAEDAAEIPAYLRNNEYVWGYDAVRHGGWATIATANFLTCIGKH